MDGILNAVCAVLNVNPDTVEYNFTFVTCKEIKRLNAKFRGVDAITDVLSFPDGDINPETGKKFLGDIAICKSAAEKQAKEFGQPAEREIVFLKIHGLLHLFGYDHERKEDEIKMRELQRAVLNELAIQ